jgi:glycosyltransferase involved in cell wall biosynthesis
MSKIGVAIPTYNRNNYLVKLLNTIPSEVAVTVCDNGSFVTESIKRLYPQAHFISSKEILPMYANWNKAIQNLNAEWVCLASDDDLFLPNAFPLLKKLIPQNPDVDIILFGNDNINETGLITATWMPKKNAKYAIGDGFFPSKYGVEAKMIGVFFKKTLYDKIGGFRETYKITASDSHFVQEALIHGKALYVTAVISQYRVWSNNLTAQTIATKGWVDEVTDWQDKIAIALKEKQVPFYNINNYHDEVIARNILAGLGTLRNKKEGLLPLLRFLKPFRYPIFANLRTHFSICRCLFSAFISG